MADRGARLKVGGAKPGSGRTSRRPSVTSSTNVLNVARSEVTDEHAGVPTMEGGILLTIKVLSAKNIKGAKGDHVNSFVRVQFADFDYKESPVVMDNPNPQYNFGVKQSFLVDETLIDTFANKKLHFTLIESLPKEKTAVLGEGELSMFPHFFKYPARDPNNPDVLPPPPPLSFKATVPISYANARLLGKDADEHTKNGPEFDVEVILSAPLIEPEVVENGTFLTFKVDDVFPVPDEWTLKEGNEKDLNSNIYTYTLNLMVPAESTPERLVSIPNGTLMVTDVPVVTDAALTTPQPIMMPKPATSSQGTNTAQLDSETRHPPAPGESDSATVPPTPSERERPVFAETIKKVSWATTHVVWMPPEAVIRLREKIQSKHMTEVEFVRELQPKFAHVVDSNVNKYRGRAIMDMSSLLFPRVMGLKGRWPLEVFEPPASPLSEGMGLGQARGALASSTTTLDSQAPGPTPSKKGRGAKDDANLYKSLGTSIGLQLLLEKPLLDKKKLQPITKSVSDFIPRRIIPPQLLYEKRSKRANEEYLTQVQAVVRKLVKEYETVLVAEAEKRGDSIDGISVGSETSSEELQRRKRLFFHLNKSGAYFMFKEQLKGAVVEVVREQFKRKSPFASKSELQLFMSEVYVYLVDQMHLLINKMFRDKSTAFVDPTLTKTADFQILKNFADTAEVDHLTDLASRYHQERIVKYEDSMQAWFDYGCFCMRNGMMSKGEECFREILSKNPKHIPSLLAYGALCCIHERFEEARVYLVTAVELQPKYTLSLTLLGLFYDVISEEEESENYLMEAAKLHNSTMPSDAPSIFLLVAEFLIHCHAGQLAERALSQEILESGPRVKPYLLLSQLEVQRSNYKLANEHLKDALSIQQDEPNVWAALGHLQYVQKLWDSAQVSYETVLSLSQEPTDISMVYTRLGSLYLRNAVENSRIDVSMARLSKSMYLRASGIAPSTASWLGAGKACMALEDWEEAEDALAEANVLNNRNADVWAYLALLNLKLNRSFEANQCIAQALRLGIRDADVLRTVGDDLLKTSNPNAAVECFRICLELDPDNETTRKSFEASLRAARDDLIQEEETQPVDALTPDQNSPQECSLGAYTATRSTALAM
ncbi:uncharacterized protein SPPG_01495 [Spizellomyces punctatus DAOM BR117]|uniref:Uncharacterized protein n=1 Tax=Spizellomyces punctatus (strain DAOM BR117) TaxID=645134 RepID=A0A0L0HT30_SPIPD|nr:uncharacterized protein SPPG_01495 [Spizellomyces punctatus DAOM BR117]KND04050.1 hypothetical protein SPPG_01495 [Spizellomyces punctatus DAOM BR117]|eukprot:XP_016612089.1 hypothetical protein SPPG_01495 [Spizellomyces punctatus DAOM BR117]